MDNNENEIIRFMVFFNQKSLILVLKSSNL
jgi:hypothetical protein